MRHALFATVFVCASSYASTPFVEQKVEDRLHELAEFFGKNGFDVGQKKINTDTTKTDTELPGTSSDFASDDPEHGISPAHIVRESKKYTITASSDPAELGKDETNDPVHTRILAELKKNTDEKVSVLFDETITNSDGKKVTVSRKRRVWGKKAFQKFWKEKGFNIDLKDNFYGYIDMPGEAASK